MPSGHELVVCWRIPQKVHSQCCLCPAKFLLYQRRWIWPKVRKLIIHDQVGVDIHKTSAFGFHLRWLPPPHPPGHFLEWRLEKVANFVLVTQDQKIVDHNIIIFFKVSFLISASVNYIIKICPVESVDTSAKNTYRAALGQHSIVPKWFLSWKMYFLLKGWETVDSGASVNVMSKVCRTNYSRAFTTNQLLKISRKKSHTDTI